LPSQTVFELLNQANEVELITCKMCGHTTTSDQERCPHCNAFLKLPTLAQYGKRLPIGILVDRRLLKDFEVRKVDFKVESEISETWKRFIEKARREQLTTLQYILNVLCHTITKLGGRDFQELPFAQRMAVLHKLYDGDPYYMYTYVRIETIGPNIDLLNLECFNCGNQIPEFSADLTSLEVATIETPNDLYKEVMLRDGFTFSKREGCKRLKIQPTTINSVLNASSLNATQQKAEQIREAVIEVEDFGDASFLDNHDLETMTKPDFDMLIKVISRHTGGPDWSVTVEGCKCGKDFRVLLPARYEDFFARSFRYDLGRIF